MASGFYNSGSSCSFALLCVAQYCIGRGSKIEEIMPKEIYVIEDDKKSGGLKSCWIQRHFTLLLRQSIESLSRFLKTCVHLRHSNYSISEGGGLKVHGDQHNCCSFNKNGTLDCRGILSLTLTLST